MTNPSRARRCRVALLTLVLCSGACSRYVQSHLDTGDAYLKAQKYQDAVNEYVKALRLDPDNWRGARQLGFAYYALGDGTSAFPYLTKALSLQPQDPEVRIRVGNIYIADRKYNEALAQADSTLAIRPNSPEGLSLRGAALMDLKDYAKAVQAYRKLNDLAPRDPSHRYYYGISSLAAGDTTTATRELEAALELSPGLADAVLRLAEIDMARRQFDAADARVRRELGPTRRSATLLGLLGSINAARNRPDIAEAAFLEAIQRAPNNPDSRVALAGLYSTRGQMDSAVAQLQAAIKATPASAQAHMLLGAIQQQRGDFQKARESFEAALSAKPDMVPAANNLAWLLSEKLGDLGRGYQYGKRAYDLAPNNPLVADTFGWILAKRGDFRGAADILKQSAAKLPNEPAAQYHYGVAAQAVGDTVGARRALRRAVDSPTDFSEKEAARRALASLK